MLFKDSLNLDHHLCYEISDRRNKLSLQVLFLRGSFFFSGVQSEDNNNPSLSLHPLFWAGVSISSQKKGLISGKAIIVLLIRQFCDQKHKNKKENGYWIWVEPTGFLLLADEVVRKWFQGKNDLAGGRWVDIEDWVLCFQPKLWLLVLLRRVYFDVLLLMKDLSSVKVILVSRKKNKSNHSHKESVLTFSSEELRGRAGVKHSLIGRFDRPTRTQFLPLRLFTWISSS